MKLGFYYYPFPADDPAAYGYALSAFNIVKALKGRPDVEVVDVGPANVHKHHLRRAGLDYVLHYCPPHLFDPSSDVAPHVLFTMYEHPWFDPKIVPTLAQSALRFAPSTFVQGAFEKEGLSAGVVPLGVSEEFRATSTVRRLITGPGAPRLRFLYVGSSTVRKGYHLIAPAWKAAFSGTDGAVHAQLYVKTVGKTQAERVIHSPWADERVVVDGRSIDTAELAALYESADVFLFPSYAEGFGLPPLEAMAAGCLVVSSTLGGLGDFIRPDRALLLPRTQYGNIGDGIFTRTEPVHTEKELAEALRLIYLRWGSPAAEQMRRCGYEFARTMTWERTAEVLVESIRGAKNQKGEAA